MNIRKMNAPTPTPIRTSQYRTTSAGKIPSSAVSITILLKKIKNTYLDEKLMIMFLPPLAMRKIKPRNGDN